MALPFASNSAQASLVVIEYDTGIKAVAPEDTIVLEWLFESCEYAAEVLVVQIDYRHTTPKNAQEGGFDTSEQEVDRTWEGGYWIGSVTFESYIDPDAKRGTNHGDISFIRPWDNEVLASWSFNVQHSNK